MRHKRTEVQKVLAKSLWYRPPRLAKLGQGWRSEASRVTPNKWATMKANPEDYGICFPYREYRIQYDSPELILEESSNAA